MHGQMIVLALLVARQMIAQVAVRGRAWHGRKLVDDAHFRQLGRILEPLELGVEELGPRLHQHHLLVLRSVRVHTAHVWHLSGRVALLRLRVTVLAMRSGSIGTRNQVPLTLTHSAAVLRPLVVQLLRIADERLLTQNYLRLLLAERALIVMI